VVVQRQISGQPKRYSLLVAGVMTLLPVFCNNYTVGHKIFAACAGHNLFFGRGIIRTTLILNFILTKEESNLG